MGRPRKTFVTVGQRFVRLVCVEEDARFPLWRCDCGLEKRIRIYDVLSGNTSSCGCIWDELLIKRNRVPRARIDLAGQRFGRLLVISMEGVTRFNDPKWKCVCDCGVTKLVTAHALRIRHTQSCGCLRTEKAIARVTTHGQSKEKSYQCAKSDKRRALQHGATVEFVDRAIVYERDMGLCQICGLVVEDGDFSLDHAIPLTKGGEHSYGNCRTAHRSCNSSKHDKMRSECSHLWMRN